MARDALNLFSPFHRLESNHENQLTRALVIVLRLSPMAHATWLRMVAPSHNLHGLPVATFATQRRALRRPREHDEQAELVSVYLTPEAPLPASRVIVESDRGQVLDAIIEYGGELVIAVENKVAEASDHQARHLNVTGANVRVRPDQEPVVVLWRDLLESITALCERSLVGGAEAGVLNDFLAYVEDHFAELGPFRTLGLAHGNAFRQERRLRQVLGEAVGMEAATSPDGPYVDFPDGVLTVALAALHMNSAGDTIEFAVYPGDTLQQARALYQRPSAVAGLLELSARPGWHAESNFHFGHMQRGFCWTRSACGLNRYIELWSKRIATERAVPRDQWPEYWAWLEREQIACSDDRPEFDRHFTSTERQSAYPRPGVKLCRRWSLAEAEALDARGALQAEIRRALNDAMAALGETLPPIQTET